MEFEYFNEQVFFSTVRITLPDETGQNASIGTGFLLDHVLSKRPDKKVTLLISNKHVFMNPTKKIILNVHQKLDQKPDLFKISTFEQSNFSNLYYEHPNPDIDLACLNVSFFNYPENNLFFRTLNKGMFQNFEDKGLVPGLDAWFVGYPDNRYDTVHNLPILRRGYIASIPKIDFNGRKEFIIDAQVFPGSSGSPVFVNNNGEMRLCGVVTQTMIKNAMVQSLNVNMLYGVQQTIGLGIVLKSELILELLEHIDNIFNI